jgi:thymidylate kinase
MGLMLDGAFAGEQPLQLGADLFDRLNRSGIRYCHWKSNIRLGKSLAGKTDLDILVAKEDLDRFIGVSTELGFRPMINRPEREYDGLSDYLGMDPASGGLLHIHLHDRLLLGGVEGKDVEFPIEALFWANLVQIGHVRVPAPDLELLVLLLRAVLKSKPRANSNPRVWFPSDIVDEVAILYRGLDEQQFAALLDKTNLGLPPAILLRLAAALTDNPADAEVLLRLRADTMAALSRYRVRGGFPDWVGRLRRSFFDSRWAKKHLAARKKRLSETGISVALIGVDGSGKSTHTEDLRRWLAWKLLCQKEYFGLPKSSRVYQYLVRRAQSFEKRARSSRNSIHRKTVQTLADLLQSARWLWSAYLRASRARRVVRLARKGAVIFCDRYPLQELTRGQPSMDGPRIRHERGSFLGLAALEEWIYSRIQRPGLTIVLQTGADAALQRKPDLKAETVARKVDLVGGIAPGPNVEIVDNGRSYEEVRADLRRLIWRRLQRAAD